MEEWLKDAADLLITVWPDLYPWLKDSADIVITAIPRFGAFLAGLPTWLHGTLAFGFLIIAWHYLESEDDEIW